MPDTKISANKLNNGDQFMVYGKTAWSRVHQQVSGAALERENARRKQRGLNPITRPYTTVTVKDAQVSPVDPANLTLAEQYAQQRFYTRPNSENPTVLHFDAMNKSSRLPWVGTINEQGTVDEIQLEGELANDLAVTLVCRVYDSGPGKNNGVSLDGVILHEPVRYFQRTSDTAKLGFTVNHLPSGTPSRLNVPEQAADTGATAPAEQYEEMENPFSAQQAAAPQQAPAPRVGGIRTE